MSIPTLHTFTIIRTAPSLFREEAPYCVGIVKDGDQLTTSRIDGYREELRTVIGQRLIRLPASSPSGAQYSF